MTHTSALVVPGEAIGAVPFRVVGAFKEVSLNVTWSSNYATGGETVLPSEFGLNYVESVLSADVITPDAENTGVAVQAIVNSTGAVVAKLNTAVAESANALAITGLVVRLTVRGK